MLGRYCVCLLRTSSSNVLGRSALFLVFDDGVNVAKGRFLGHWTWRRRRRGVRLGVEEERGDTPIAALDFFLFVNLT